MITIIDYGMGSLRSVQKAAAALGKSVRVTDSPVLIKKSHKIIFPGVGHFGKAVKELKARGLYQLLKDKIKDGVPFLGICLGMQLLFEASEEAKGANGLAVLEGNVKLFRLKNLIVPHMGWNQIRLQAPVPRLQAKNQRPKISPLLKNIPDGSYFYFAHSYYCRPADKGTILTTTDYGRGFASSVNKDNVWGVQFHPEKSQDLGLRVFNNFLDI